METVLKIFSFSIVYCVFAVFWFYLSGDALDEDYVISEVTYLSHFTSIYLH